MTLEQSATQHQPDYNVRFRASLQRHMRLGESEGRSGRPTYKTTVLKVDVVYLPFLAN
ncbi:MAG: hypothetical protein ACHBN1_17160 [Heteroscytonema crispum UTEX LB 1556]